MHLLKNKKGVAIMLVLAAISVLTAMGVEFAYNTNVYHNLAQSQAPVDIVFAHRRVFWSEPRR